MGHYALSNSEEPTTYPQGFKLKHSGKDTTAQELVLRHGRDVLPTRDKSAIGNVALRFWVLVLSRSRDERLLSF